MNNPLKTIRKIGDKLLRDTPFQYCLKVAGVLNTLDRLHFVDFGRAFGLGRAALAYAWTQITVEESMNLKLHLEHNDGCVIWLNGVEIYARSGDRDICLRFDERSIDMSGEVELPLRKGTNALLMKSETRGAEWGVFLQPPSTKGAVIDETISHPVIGLGDVEQIDGSVADLSNWLVLGPFPNPIVEGQRAGLHMPQRPETDGVEIGRMYEGLAGPVTWTVPKVEVLGSMIDPRPWGTNYDWNYHNGGVAWAMQSLAALSNDDRYGEYATRFCDFHLNGIPFVKHQVRTLNAVESANHFIIDTPLLDFTLAPSLPVIHRLRMEEDFPNREVYVEWIEKMISYARDGQVRLPGHGIYTRTTPVEFTTWVDDMFMGIPFLIQAALYAANPKARQAFFDDAANQVLEFNTQVWDDEAELYMHARYFANPAKLPYWSRCNGWASWAMSEVLLHLPSSHPKYEMILRHFRTHCSSLLRYQDKNGLWPNVLNRPDSKLEVSGTAIFVMAMARGLLHGWLGEEEFKVPVISGWKGLVSHVDADGTVHGICRGTMCTEDVEYYVNRPFYDDDTHGLFAVLFAGIEMEQLQRKWSPVPVVVG